MIQDQEDEMIEIIEMIEEEVIENIEITEDLMKEDQKENFKIKEETSK